MIDQADAPVHMLKGVTRDRGERIIKTRCGRTIGEPYSEPLTAGTGWADRVTCPDCRPQKGPA